MTQEEKAKAYDEALERARKQRDDYQKELNKADKNSQLAGLLRAGVSAIELAFPELAESEDEKIRKEMIDEIKAILRGEDLGFPPQDVLESRLAYLERQKGYELTEEDKKIIPEALVMLCDDIINHRVHTPIKTDEEGARKIKAFLKTFNRQPYKTREEWEKQKEPQHAIRATKGFGDPDGPQFELVDIQEEQKPAEWQYQKDRCEFAKLKAKEWRDMQNNLTKERRAKYGKIQNN